MVILVASGTAVVIVSLKKPMVNPDDDDYALDFFFANDDYAEPRL